MVLRRRGSKFGEGLGGAVSNVTNPNNPSYDAAARSTGTDKKITELLALPEGLTDWERKFLMDVYGADKLTKQQHITVWKIFKDRLPGSNDQATEKPT